MKPKYRESRTN